MFFNYHTIIDIIAFSHTTYSLLSAIQLYIFVEIRVSPPCRPRSQDRSDGGVNEPDTRILRKRTNLFCFPKYLIPAKKAYTFSKTFCFNTSKVHLFPIKTTKMMIKQLIYDSCMIVEMRTIIAVYLDIQPSHKKHDGMMVVSKSSFIDSNILIQDNVNQHVLVQ